MNQESLGMQDPKDVVFYQENHLAKEKHNSDRFIIEGCKEPGDSLKDVR
jgi:hypothetical protein